METFAPQAWALALLCFRSAAFVLAAPLFSMRAGPGHFRAGLAAALSLVAWLSAGAPPAPLPEHLGAVVLGVVTETGLGLFPGLAVRFLLESAAMAGHLAATSMGLGFGALVDPVNGAESTALSQLFRLLGLAGALGLGLERELVEWLARSVAETPPGSVDSIAGLARAAVGHCLVAIVLGTRVGFPFLAATTLGHVALGLLGRAAQQLHISNVGFSVSLLFGGGALWLLAPTALRVVASMAARPLAS